MAGNLPECELTRRLSNKCVGRLRQSSTGLRKSIDATTAPVNADDFFLYGIQSHVGGMRSNLGLMVGGSLDIQHADVPEFRPPRPVVTENERGIRMFDPADNVAYLQYVESFLSSCNTALSKADRRLGALN